MKRIVLSIILVFIGIYTSYAQVETRYFPKGEPFKELRRSHSQKSKIIQMPAFDLNEVMADEKDIKGEVGKVLKFGKGFDVYYTLSDGKWEDMEEGRLWSMSITSKNAISLNFIFDDLHLPSGAELYIENDDKTIVYGPVTSKCITQSGPFLTDIIRGECVNIYLFEPSDVYNQSSLSITRVVHGFKDVIGEIENAATRSAYSDLVEHEKEADGVGIVLSSNGTQICSGALLMDTDYSFTPYFLTLFEIIDNNGDGQLTDDEKAHANNGMFKFRVRKDENGIPLTSYTYNHSTFRAGWSTTHFLLLEISGNVRNNPNLTWLGWDKSSQAPSSGYCIYPAATTDGYLTFGSSSSSFVSPGLADPNNWKSSFYNAFFGSLSTSSPLFNSNNKVVGFYYAYQTVLNKADFTRFYLSWTGGGTNSTRLSNWLDPNSTGQTTMDSYRSMIISGPSTIISSSTYSIINLPSGMSVSWSLSDSYYNQNGLQQNTPSTNQCTITKHSGHSMSSAVLTANIKKNGITICTASKLVSTGNGFDGTYYNGITTKQIDLPTPLYVLPGTLVTINSQNLIGATVSQNGGNVTPTSWQFNGSSGVLIVGMPSSVGSAVVVKVVCSGGAIYNLPITTIASDSGQLMLSRAGNIIEVSFDAHDGNAWSIDVSNAITGEKVYNKKEIGSSHNINTEGWKSGIYIIKAAKGKESVKKKITIK